MGLWMQSTSNCCPSSNISSKQNYWHESCRNERQNADIVSVFHNLRNDDLRVLAKQCSFEERTVSRFLSPDHRSTLQDQWASPWWVTLCVLPSPEITLGFHLQNLSLLDSLPKASLPPLKKEQIFRMIQSKPWAQPTTVLIRLEGVKGPQVSRQDPQH